MTDDTTTETLALLRDLAAGLGLPVGDDGSAPAFAAALNAMEAASPGAAARLRSTLARRLRKSGAVAVAAGAVH